MSRWITFDTETAEALRSEFDAAPENRDGDALQAAVESQNAVVLLPASDNGVLVVRLQRRRELPIESPSEGLPRIERRGETTTEPASALVEMVSATKAVTGMAAPAPADPSVTKGEVAEHHFAEPEFAEPELAPASAESDLAEAELAAVDLATPEFAAEPAESDLASAQTVADESAGPVFAAPEPASSHDEWIDHLARPLPEVDPWWEEPQPVVQDDRREDWSRSPIVRSPIVRSSAVHSSAAEDQTVPSPEAGAQQTPPEPDIMKFAAGGLLGLRDEPVYEEEKPRKWWQRILE